MSGLMLCKRPIAAVPYYIDESSLNIYSLEELSYYIYNNTYLINGDFICADLCHWIGSELDMKDLEHTLLEFISEDISPSVFIGHLLREIGYLTDTEIKKVSETIAEFENISEAERKKIRADQLLDKDKLVDAIFEYENILDNCNAKSFTKVLQGDIWHNLGVCYARLFLFSEAASCFEYAYGLNKKRDSLEELLICYRCNKDQTGFDKICSKYYVPDQMAQQIKQYVSDTACGGQVADFNRKINEILVNKSSEEEFTNKLKKIIKTWEEEYIALCKG